MVSEVISVIEELKRERPDLLGELLDYVSSVLEDELGEEVRGLDDLKSIASRRPGPVAEAIADFFYFRVVRPVVEAVTSLIAISAPGLESYSPSAIEGLPGEVRVKVEVLRSVVSDFRRLLKRLGVEADRYELPEV